MLGFATLALAEEEIPTIIPHNLHVNPFFHKGEKVILNPQTIVNLDDGTVYETKPGGPLKGFYFSKMIEENVALYEILGVSRETFTYSRDYDDVGYLIPSCISKFWG